MKIVSYKKALEMQKNGQPVTICYPLYDCLGRPKGKTFGLVETRLTRCREDDTFRKKE